MKNSPEKYPIKLENGIYVVTGQPKTDLPIRFLVRNTIDNELFLLFGKKGTYLLLKGNEEKGLRTCEAEMSQRFNDCYAFGFSQDNFYGIITDPDSTKDQKPSYWHGQAQIPLEIELLEIIG